MTRGADIIAAIILLALAIAIAVYLLHWLYRRSSKEVSFVRTGMLGEKVVISGGAFVLPIIHNITQVGMRTLSINIKRAGDKSLITKDRMRAELVTEFFTKVPPDKNAVVKYFSVIRWEFGHRDNFQHWQDPGCVWTK